MNPRVKRFLDEVQRDCAVLAVSCSAVGRGARRCRIRIPISVSFCQSERTPRTIRWLSASNSRGSSAEYMGHLEKRRACERLLRLSIQCMRDICALFVSGLRLDLGSDDPLGIRGVFGASGHTEALH
jgi:hypothetical protein